MWGIHKNVCKCAKNMEGRNLKNIVGMTGNLEFRITESMTTTPVIIVIEVVVVAAIK